MKRLVTSAAVLCLIAAATPALAQLGPGAPRRVGQCANTVIQRVGYRLQDGSTGRSIPGSGSSIRLANGVVGISYDQVRAVDRSRRGDRVRVCLVSIPRACPPGDDRGRMYRTTNLRTRQSWTLPDSQHMCGGA